LVTPDDRERYAAVLTEIVARTQAARAYLNQEATSATIEYSALQMRMVLESIVMGSLITNRAHIEGIASALAKKNARAARKLAKAANPDYWPIPVRVADDVFEVQMLDGVLREDAWGREWGMLSELLHARNPFRSPLDVEEARDSLRRLLAEVLALLNKHVVRLADSDFMVIGQIDESGSYVAPLRRFSDAEAPSRDQRSAG